MDYRTNLGHQPADIFSRKFRFHRFLHCDWTGCDREYSLEAGPVHLSCIFYASCKYYDGNILFPGLFQDTRRHFPHHCLPISPSFTGKDLDGGEVNSDALFSGNAVTVVNFWFTTCGPCVAELSELDAMNKELAEKGGELIGINAFTLDGDEKASTEAKETLDKNGATYRNIFFDSDSDAGKFTAGIYAYPTTYVVDRNGNIVGDPIVGAITNKNQMEELQKQIDTAIATDSVK